ncbi:MAG: hypothetical protein AAFU64_04305, partial [Bacteroidota bacterium]
LLNGSAGNGDGKHSFIEKLKGFVGQFGMKSDDVRNLTISALIFKMLNMTNDDQTKGILNSLLGTAQKAGVLDQKASNLL